MPDPADLWKLRARSLEKARKALKRGEPEGLHDLRVALRRLSATATALGRRQVSREAKGIVHSLSSQRQLQVDRQLLSRIAQLRLLSPDAVAGLAARWEKLSERGERRVSRAADGRALQSLKKKAERLARSIDGDEPLRLETARQKAEKALRLPLEGKDDETLHRFRIAVKKARYLAEDLAVLGTPGLLRHVEREKALQEALGRWNDLRMFRRRLEQTRDEAEERGAVTLAAELEHLLTTLEPTIATVRRAAVEASKGGRVVPLAAGSSPKPRRVGGSGPPT